MRCQYLSVRADYIYSILMTCVSRIQYYALRCYVLADMSFTGPLGENSLVAWTFN